MKTHLRQDPLWDTLSDKTDDELREVLSSGDYTETAKNIAEEILQQRGEEPGERVSQADPRKEQQPKSRRKWWLTAFYVSLAIGLLVGGLKLATRYLEDSETPDARTDFLPPRPPPLTDARADELELGLLSSVAQTALGGQAEQEEVLAATAMVLYEAQEYRKAIEQFRKAEKACIDSGRTRDLFYSNLLNNTAAAYKLSGDHAQAVAYLERAIEVSRTDAVGDKALLAAQLGNLAETYMGWRKYEKVLPVLEEALELTVQNVGENHPDVAYLLGGLGLAHSELGQPDKAMPYYERALRINRAALGDSHADVVGSLLDLGLGYRDLGEHENAIEVFEQALNVMVKTADQYEEEIPAVKDRIEECRGKLDK